MTHTARVAAATLAAALLAGCASAPFGPSSGPAAVDGPRPLLPQAHDNPRALIQWFRPDYGHLLRPASAETVHVAVCGDNRPGPRLATTPWGLGAIMDADSRDPVSWLWAAANVPVLLVQALVPRLDGARDVGSSRFTHRYDGGGEVRVRDALLREPAMFVLNTGDLVENGRRGEHWDRFRELHRTVLSKIPYVAAPGNHERNHDPVARASFNAALGWPAGTDRHWFTLDLPESLGRFVVLDSNLLTDAKDVIPDSLEEALVEAQLWYADSALAETEEGVVRFLVLHHPLISAGQHASDWRRDRPGGRQGMTRRQRLLDICARRGVTAVFAGHEHLYQRVWVEDGQGRGFWHITTGGAGSPLHRIGRAEAREARALVPAGWTVRWNPPVSDYHYCRLTFPLYTRRAVMDVMRVNALGRGVPLERIDLASRP